MLSFRFENISDFDFLVKDAQPTGVGCAPIAIMSRNAHEGPSESRGEHFLMEVC